MGKIYLLCLVIGLAATSCQREVDFPLDIWVSTSCNETEMVSVRDAIDEINSLGQELVGHDLIVIAGRIGDDEDYLNTDGMSDNRSTLTCYHEQTEDFKDYIDMSGYPSDWILGNGFPEMDVFIYVFNMEHQTAENECDLPDDWPEDVDLPDGAVCPIWFRHTVTHELGHFIGLGHIPDKDAIMSPYAYDLPLSFNDNDKAQFCCIHECLTDEYECTLDNVPTGD